MNDVMCYWNSLYHIYHTPFRDAHNAPCHGFYGSRLSQNAEIFFVLHFNPILDSWLWKVRFPTLTCYPYWAVLSQLMCKSPYYNSATASTLLICNPIMNVSLPDIQKQINYLIE